MDVIHAINERRAYSSLSGVRITPSLIKELAFSAGLSPSCNNNQPWRYVFVYSKPKLEELFSVLSEGNKWAKKASMIIAVFSKEALDCISDGRKYNLFDTGLATGFLILRATELGLVAHPIAGYDEKKAKAILKIPYEMTLITLIIVGKKSMELPDYLSEKQKANEIERPKRLPFNGFVYLNEFSHAADWPEA